MARICGGMRLYGDKGTNAASRSSINDTVLLSDPRLILLFPIPFIQTGDPPIPFTVSSIIFRSLRSEASLTMIQFAPLSMTNDVLSVSTIKQYGSIGRQS